MHATHKSLINVLPEYSMQIQQRHYYTNSEFQLQANQLVTVVNSERLYSSAVLLGDQHAGTMTQFPTEWYPTTELASPSPILVIPNTKLGSDKYKIGKPSI